MFVCTDNLISTDLTYLPYTNWFLFYKIIFYSEEDEEKDYKICRQRTIKQTKNSSNTEATLILCGSSGERANNTGDSTIKEEVRRRKMRKFADKEQSNREQFKN